MCGICGIFEYERHEPIAQELVHRMNETIVHRGPDDEGIFIDGGLGFGFRRLSIIDLAGGHQPLSNEDGKLWVMLNGEIYNYPELRKDLESRGHKFATHSDTETIVHLYEEYGEDCFRRRRGMGFAPAKVVARARSCRQEADFLFRHEKSHRLRLRTEVYPGSGRFFAGYRQRGRLRLFLFRIHSRADDHLQV